MENEEQVEEWFEEIEEASDYNDPMIEPKFESNQVCAVMFLYDKLKPEEKKQNNNFFHGEHDILFIGASMDVFQDFTREDVAKAVSYGISISSEGDGFEIYASM